MYTHVCRIGYCSGANISACKYMLRYLPYIRNYGTHKHTILNQYSGQEEIVIFTSIHEGSGAFTVLGIHSGTSSQQQLTQLREVE